MVIMKAEEPVRFPVRGNGTEAGRKGSRRRKSHRTNESEPDRGRDTDGNVKALRGNSKASLEGADPQCQEASFGRSNPGTLREEWMSPDNLHAEREQELRRRLREFSGRTRRRAAVLTGRQELAKSVDPDHIIRELMDNWTDNERLLVRHGAFYPLIDKVRRIRNSVERHGGRFTRSERVHTGATRSIGMLDLSIRSAGAEEDQRRKREAEAASPAHGRRDCSRDRPSDSHCPDGLHRGNASMRRPHDGACSALHMCVFRESTDFRSQGM